MSHFSTDNSFGYFEIHTQSMVLSRQKQQAVNNAGEVNLALLILAMGNN